MFGFSFGELLVISLVTLVAVGPQKLPGVLKTMGHWARKLRKMTLDVRQQTGIDEMLRAEGIQLSELRSLMRDYHPASIAASLSSVANAPPAPIPAAPSVTSPISVSANPAISSAAWQDDPYQGLEPDPTREYPPEGADAYGALPDDLLEPSHDTQVAAAPGQPEADPAAAVSKVPGNEPAQPPAPPVPAVASPVPTAAPSVAVAALVPAVAKAPSVRPRSAPPPPPVRASSPRSSNAPPPPPRRSGAPASEPDAAVKPSTESPPPSALPSTRGSANGNG